MKGKTAYKASLCSPGHGLIWSVSFISQNKLRASHWGISDVAFTGVASSASARERILLQFVSSRLIYATQKFSAVSSWYLCRYHMKAPSMSTVKCWTHRQADAYDIVYIKAKLQNNTKWILQLNVSTNRCNKVKKSSTIKKLNLDKWKTCTLLLS